MPVKFFHRTGEITEYTVLTHIGVWVDKPKLIKLESLMQLQAKTQVVIKDYYDVINIIPQGLPTQPRGVLAYSSSPSSIDISWMLSEITEPISGFQVSYGTNPEAEEFRVEVERESDSVEIQDLKPDSLYYLKIYAINAAGRSDAVRRSVQTLGEFILNSLPCPQDT